MAIPYTPSDWEIIPHIASGAGTVEDPYVYDFTATHRITGETIIGTTDEINTLVSLKQAKNTGLVGIGTIAVENNISTIHSTCLTINSILPAIAGGAALGVGKLIYTFPAGEIIFESASINLGITQTTGKINTDTPVIGIGTIVAVGAISVLSSNAAFQSILVGTAVLNCTGTKLIKTFVPTAPLVITTTSAHSLYLNVAGTWTALGDPAAIISGIVIINWRFMS